MKSKALKLGRAATSVGKKFGQLIKYWARNLYLQMALNIGPAESGQIELEIKSEETI